MSFAELLETVKSRAKEESAKPFGRVLDAMVEAIHEQRQEILAKIIERYRDAQRELRKLKEDVTVYDDSGKITSAGYTKETSDKRKKLNEMIEKLDEAFVEAKSGDWQKAEKLAK